MGKIANFVNEKYYGVAGSVVFVAGGVTTAASTALIGPFGFILGVGTSVVAMGAAILFQPRTEDEILRLTGKSSNESFPDIMKMIEQNADEAKAVEMGGERNAGRNKADLNQIQSVLNKAKNRRATLGDELLGKVVEISDEILSIIQRPDDSMNVDFIRVKEFDRLLYRNFPDTLEAFFKTSGADSDEKLREDFSAQLDTLKEGARSILRGLDDYSRQQFDQNGFYLRSVYMSDSSEQHGS